MRLQAIPVSKKHCCIFATALASCLWSFATYADTPPDSATQGSIPKSQLLKLGQDFAQEIGGDFSQADLYLKGAGKLELAEHKSHTRLQDDEPLIMHGIVGKDRVNLKQDIYAIKRNHRLMISLGDFCSASDLAIKVNAAKGTADGWFFKEPQTFHLDVTRHEAVISGQAIAIAPSDIEADGKDILVSADVMEKWFNISFDYNFADLALFVTGAQPFPAEDAYRRSQLLSSKGYGDEPAKLPRQETAYGMATLPYVDATLNTTYERPVQGQSTRSGSWGIITASDLAGFNLQTFSSGTLTNPYLTDFRMTMGKQDIDGNLLGPLHATAYQFGDVNTVPLPLITTNTQEQGMMVTNLPPSQITTQTSAPINGDAQPGWDVELYRNDVYIDIRHVDGSGRYDFGNVDLIVGDNDFKLMFYGTKGEVNEQHRHINVNPTEIPAGKSYYAASLSREGIVTYNSSKPTTPGIGDPRLVASYQYGLGGLGTLDFGVRSSNDQGTTRNFGETGIASSFLGTFVNADVGYDLDNAAYATSITARRNFGKQSGLLQYTLNSSGYNIASATPATIKDTLRSTLSGPLRGHFLLLDHLNYNLGVTDTKNFDGSSTADVTTSLTGRYKTMLLSAATNYTRTTDVTGTYSDLATADLQARGFAWGGNWRVEAEYQVKPVTQITKDVVEYDHPVGPNVDTLTQVTYTPNPSLTQAELSLNWRTPKATFSPLISIDTNKNLTLGLNVHFGAGFDPYSNRYNIYNAYLAQAGGVAARVFFDKNGDGLYDAGDELLPEVEVKALQAHKSDPTNAQGIAFIPDLEENIVTDVVVDQATLKDSFDMSTFAGVSINPHPGGVTQLEFPIVAGGEMDGQADYIDADGKHQPGRNVKVSLIAPDGKVEKTADAAYDGYWSISSIRPGIYNLVATPPDGAPEGAMTPKAYEFKPEGSTYYGQPVILTGGHNIGFNFRSVNAAPYGTRNTRIIRPTDIAAEEVLIDLGHFHSRLALAFAWYEFRLKSGWSGLFDPVTPVSSMEPDATTHEMTLMLKPRQHFTLEQGAFACRRLADMGFNCAVETVTRYNEATPAPAPTASAGPVKAASR